MLKGLLPQKVKDKMRASEKTRFINNKMNTPFSQWPPELLEWMKEKTKGIGISGGVLSDLLEVWFEEHN